MKRAFLSGILALTLLCGSVSAAPLILPEQISGGSPSGLCAAKDGSCLFTDSFNKVIWLRKADGTLTKLAGQIGVKGLNGIPKGRYLDGTLDTAFFTEPWDICPVLEGYAVSDTASHVLRYIDKTGVQTLVGSGKRGSKDATGTAAEFSRPTGLATDEEGNLYIADTDNGCIRRMNEKGEVTTLVSGLSDPTGLCWADGKLYIAETGANRIRVYQDGLSTLVGDEQGYTNGLIDRVRLSAPQDVAVGPDGAIYIADTGNGCIRRLRDDTMTTIMDMAELEYGPIQPRSLLLQGDVLWVTDPFASLLFSIELSQKGFQDIPEDLWCRDAVYKARALRLTNGTGNGCFSPNRPMTRAQFVTMLSKLQNVLDGSVVIDGEQSFGDIPEELWCAESVRWAADQGITKGNKGMFLPNEPLTRQQLVTFLWKFTTVAGQDNSPYGSIQSFEDADAVAPYAREAMAWAVGAGLILGNDGKLNPCGQASRAHGAAILVRYLDWLQA